VIERFVKLARLAKDWGVYNITFEVVAALNSKAVARLVNTWYKVPSKVKQELAALNDIVSPDRNSYHYRAALKSSQSTVPYLGTLMKDVESGFERTAILGRSQ